MSRKPCGSEARRRGAEAAELVARAKAGDAKAFDELVRKYRARVYSLALHLTGQASDADDITQDAFLKAYHKLPEFEGRSEFFTWIYRITGYEQSERRSFSLLAWFDQPTPFDVVTSHTVLFHETGLDLLRQD